MAGRSMRLTSLVVLLTAITGCTTAIPPPPRVLAPPAPQISLEVVLGAVSKAAKRRTPPADLTPSLATAADDHGFDNEKCEAGPRAVRIEPCVLRSEERRVGKKGRYR